MVFQRQLKRINFLVKFFADPCDAPLTVYAQWAWPAFVDAFLTYFVFDLFEMLTQSFRSSFAPLRSRSARKGARGKKSGRNRFLKKAGQALDWDPNEQVGKKLAKWGRPVEHIRGLKAALWIVHGVLQRATFFFFIAELTLDFFYQWMSMVQRVAFCDAQGATVFLASDDDEVFLAIVEFNPVGFGTIEKIRGNVDWNSFAGSFTGKNATISCGMRLTPWSPIAIGSEVGLQLKVVTGSGEYTLSTSSGVLHTAAGTYLSVEASVDYECAFYVTVTVEYGAARGHDMRISLFGDENEVAPSE